MVIFINRNKAQKTTPCGMCRQALREVRFSIRFFSFYETVINRLVHGNGIPMGIPWDGAARIAFPMNDNEL